MATLTENAQRLFGGGGFANNIDLIASDIIFEHAAVGLAIATGLARPLVAGDVFAGFAGEQADNSAGSAQDIDVQLIRKGVVTLTVADVVITDVGKPVYASDDDTFTMFPVAAEASNTFIGFVMRWKSSGVAEVSFNANDYIDPFGNSPREMLSVDKTLDIQDNGKVLFMDTDAKIITLPATVTPLECVIANAAAYGVLLLSISPNASDKIQGPDLPGTNDKDHQLTKVTSQRGDLVSISNAGDTNGAIINRQIGIWVTES